MVSDVLRDPVFEKYEREMIDERNATSRIDDSSKKRDSTYKIKAEPRETEIHYGLIASTSLPIRNKAIRDKLDASLGNYRLLCIDTESSELINFPCIVIRGISDYADEQPDACKDWQGPAAAVAAAFAKEVLSVLSESEVARLPTIESMGPSVF
ncbi:hypothetical protein F4679DRAFT_587555 [Xylaria curta]|nr:hypothetical protein F4679DRAFT_587555 [Xylaria curta]